jgi:D-sedoheptulose 7-phosphate isomerase
MVPKRICQIFAEAAAAHQAAANLSTEAICRAVEAIQTTIVGGGKLLVFGNGGSAADAQHFAAEFVGRFQRSREPFPALALTTDTSVITSIANDFHYDQVFARQVQALGREGDVAFAITTSGRSPNVLVALEQAKRQRLKTIALVGSGRDGAAAIADIAIAVPTDTTARVQEVHRTILHIVCELVEQQYVAV